MDTYSYPGRGLSLSKLIYALSEELKHAAYSPLYVANGHFGLFEVRYTDYLCRFDLEAVSQLDRDASFALATIREWRNSFTRVNRIPTDILSLIPTRLPVQEDRFHVASVCHHWRRVFCKHGALWSRLSLRRGGEYVSTLLERARGSVLDIAAFRDLPISTITLISPHAQQIRSLEFMRNHWQDIITFSESTSGRLLLLRTLAIIPPTISDSLGRPDVSTFSPLPIFSGSINMERFVFRSRKLSLLSHFLFPNLTAVELSTDLEVGECSASCLLDFLKASAMLEAVDMKISAIIALQNVPEKMVVILPNVKTFFLHVANGPATQVY